MLRWLCTLLLLFITSGTFAQPDLKEFYLRKTIRQDGLQCQFSVLDDHRHGVWLYRKHKRYHWFKAQLVISTEGASSGVLLHGLYEAFYDNKQLAKRGQFTKGLKSGEWMFWYEDGSLARIEHWKNGALRGEQIDYLPDGSVDVITRVKGKTVSEFHLDTLRTVRGNSEEIKVFDDRGRVAYEENRRYGVLHGKVCYYEDGKKIRTEQYREGELVPEKQRAEKPADGGEEKEPFLRRIFRKKAKDGAEAPAENTSGKEKKGREDKEKGEKTSGKEPREKKEKPVKEEKVKEEKNPETKAQKKKEKQE